MHDRLGKKLMRWRHRLVLPQLRGRAMDIGCGYNDLIREYRDNGGEGVGVDVYPWPGADRVVDDTAVLDYPDQSFDSVAIIAALNHIPNREAVLREVHRLLRPDGRIVLTMIPPRLSWLWHTLRKPWDADQTERGMKAGEVYGLTGRQVHDLLKQTGFAPAEGPPVHARPQPPDRRGKGAGADARRRSPAPRPRPPAPRRPAALTAPGERLPPRRRPL